jgi:predicted DsbA family dithiol-disulfide isomerase
LLLLSLLLRGDSHHLYGKVLLPYQLYPEAPAEGQDKYEWYKTSRYGGSEAKMKMYTTLMAAYGASAGINYKFGRRRRQHAPRAPRHPALSGRKGA